MWLPELNSETRTKYLAIVEAIAGAIERGELRAGDRLPTHRDLAWHLGVNVSTVTQAYREAARRHLVGGEVGRGTFVLADSKEAALFALKDTPPDSVIDLSTNIPSSHPDDARSAELLAAHLRGGGGEGAFGYLSPQLLTRALVAGSKWLAWRGIEAKPAAVIPVAGAQQALLACLLVLCEAGATVLTEEFTFPGMKAIARQLGLRLQGLACDQHGVIPEAFEAALRTGGAKVAVFMPNLHNPTGSVMPPVRRRAIAALARRYDFPIVEDDVYGGLADSPPLALECPEQTILISGLSKAVAPGLRFALVRGAERWITPIRAEVHATHWAMSPFMLELACAWIETGYAIQRAEWQRGEVRARWNLAKAKLQGRGGVDWTRQPSPHLWLSAACPGEEAVERARRAGVEVVSGTLFAAGRGGEGNLRISLTAPVSRAHLSLALEHLNDCGIFG